ncbi:hypothetical protein EK0264_04825 [Epidermidibacterium keratini]|uniref:DNA-3-methyladenine glycosylase II n=1 Tax=Epidermidibacterium keratini TaxID=1891644 RepID=A0A7L4YKD1_9ACTN|nr:AlkA N-terminal domain-containing protein [Epidermidibacterium keratini]QHB99675.1 hypothetical protein EK0264_04825 [Epidermidibacterium keratini]
MTLEYAEPRTRRYRLRAPYHRAHLFGFLASRAIPGAEVVSADGEAWCYARTLRLPGGPAVFQARATGRTLAVCAWSAPGDQAAVDAAVRRVFDLDADSAEVDAELSDHPELAPLVAARPGLHLPGAADPHELVVRALVGQQISVAGASTICGRIASEHGEPLSTPVAGLTHLFPTADALAAIDPGTLPMPRNRGRAIAAVSAQLADSTINLHPDNDRDGVRRALLAAPGIGPWTADYVLMRALGDRDVLLSSDLIIRRAAAQHAMPEPPRELAEYAARFAPLRSYVNHHLWAAYSA